MRSREGTDDAAQQSVSAPFDRFAEVDGERLRRVLVAQHGVEVGNDVHADDGIHLRADGVRFYSQLILDVLGLVDGSTPTDTAG